MSFWSDLLGTTGSFFRLGFTGPRLKDVSGVLAIRNAGDSADANLTVLDAAYAAGWSGSGQVPTKNALYDKIQTLTGITVSASAPSDTTRMWVDSSSFVPYIYFNDGTSSQWASLAGATGPKGDTGATGSTGPKAITIQSPVTGVIPLFYTTNALTLSRVQGSVAGSATPTVTFSLLSGTSRASADATNVNAQSITSTTTGDNITIAAAGIAATSWVWLNITTVSGTVTDVNITLEF